MSELSDPVEQQEGNRVREPPDCNDMSISEGNNVNSLEKQGELSKSCRGGKEGETEILFCIAMLSDREELSKKGNHNSSPEKFNDRHSNHPLPIQ